MTEQQSSATTGFSYAVSRQVDAPAAKVWAAWTDAGQYTQWFGAKPGTVALDPRPGGAWQATLVLPDGTEIPLTGSYVEVEEPRRLVVSMDIPGAEPGVMTAEFVPGDGGTKVTLTQTSPTAEERDQSKEGSEMLLEQLAAFVAED